MKKILFIISFMSISSMIFSQSITFDYSSPGLNNSCNVFAYNPQLSTPILYQGYEHTTSFGFPNYSTVEKAIVLESRPINFTNDGATQLAIKYTFKQGYNYVISINYKGLRGTNALYFPEVALRWGTSNGGLNNMTTCTGPTSIDHNDHANTYSHAVSSQNYIQSPTLWSGTPPQTNNYLWIASTPAFAAWNNESGILSKIFIKNIIITETPPTPQISFTLSPSTVNINCGTQAPQTFTVNNVNNTAGVSGYEWNLGANNGWLYNGVAAPATINTTANTITLTKCGLSQKNVSAKANIAANQYNTNTATVSNNCNYSIVGNSSFCSFFDYSINNLPSNANVVWSLSNNTTASLSCTNCATTRVTKIGYPAYVTLRASITVAGCNSILLLEKPLVVGNTQPPLFLNPTYNLNCNSVTLTIQQANNTGITAPITWTTTGGLLINDNISPYTATGNSVTISGPNGEVGDVVAVSTNPCDRFIKSFTHGGCLPWIGNPYLLLTWGAPVRGEPLQGRLEPLPDLDNNITYYWFINGNFVSSSADPSFGSYEWPCNYGNPGNLSVISVSQLGGSTNPLNAEFSPSCNGARISNNTNALSVFPNPTSGIISIRLDEIVGNNDIKLGSGSIENTIQIKIFDKQGKIRKVYLNKAKEKLITIDVSDLSNDIYYVEVSNGKIVKRIPFNVLK